MKSRSPAGADVRNRIIEALPKKLARQLLLKMEPVELRSGKVLFDVDDTITHAYFPDQGSLISLVAVSRTGVSVEVGMVGNEGLAGVPIFHGAKGTPHQILVQGPGTAARIAASTVQSFFIREETFRSVVLAYMNELLVYMSQIALCNRIHPVEQRLSSWLLMAQDRVYSDRLPLTQDFLSKMLGSNRATVSTAAGILQERGFITYARGKITIKKRKELEAYACECYQAIKNRTPMT